MTNGLAVGNCRATEGSFDYWEDGKCSSGYNHGLDSIGLVLRSVKGKSLRKDLWKQWEPLHTLAAPEQLVWWGEE